MSDRVRIAQVGLGYWGPNLLRNLLTVGDAHVTWAVDQDPDRLHDARERAGGLKVTTEYGEVLASDDVDAVVIATPAALHFQMVRQALLAGKHALVEKPLAMTSAESRELAELAKSRDLVLMVGHTFLYNAAVRKVRQYIVDGELGDVLYLYSQRLNLGRVRKDVNALWNFAPHDISIILYLLGARPSSVAAQGFAYLQPSIADVVFCNLTFPDGRAAHLHISWLDPLKVRRMTVVGTQKMAVYDDTSSDAKIALYDRGMESIPTAQSPKDFANFAEYQLLPRRGDVVIPAFKFPEPLQTQCAHFVECVRNGQTPLTDAMHGLAVVEVLEAAQRSMDTKGRPQPVDAGDVAGTT